MEVFQISFPCDHDGHNEKKEGDGINNRGHKPIGFSRVNGPNQPFDVGIRNSGHHQNRDGRSGWKTGCASCVRAETWRKC